MRAAQEQVQTERQAGDGLRARAHSAQIESVKLGEIIERVKHRSGQIAGELAAKDLGAKAWVTQE